MKLSKEFTLFIWFSIFSLVSHLLIGLEQIKQPFNAYYFYLAVIILYVLAYLILLKKRPKNNWNWKVGALFTFVATMATPIVYETDHLRYIWDGIQPFIGFNPYALSPSSHPGFTQTFWSVYINHPELETIYPPFAQIVFMISSGINPFFWNNYFHWDVFSGIEVTSYYQIELGWKLMVGFFATGLIYLWRNRRWDLLVTHPLFLFMFIGNGHIDALVALLIGFCLDMSFSQKNERNHNILLVCSILTKWYTIILYPLYFWYWKKKWGTSQALSSLFLSISLGICLSIFYFLGSEGKFFSSLLKFGGDWYFFGFIQRFMMDLLILFNQPSLEALKISKYIAAVLFVLGYFGIYWLFLKNKITLRFSVLLGLMYFFSLSPIINPWYLLVILPLALRYNKPLFSPMAWSLLCLSSTTYFISYKDPVYIRYLVYILLSLFLFLDYKKIQARFKKLQLVRESASD